MALSIQERIKDLRLDRGLTLKQLAEQDCSCSIFVTKKICATRDSKRSQKHRPQWL